MGCTCFVEKNDPKKEEENNNYNKQKQVNPHSKDISTEGMKLVSNQMEKSICKIKCNDGSHGTGFFCKIPFKSNLNLLPVLITNNHVLKEEDIKINNKIQFSINNDNMTYIINIDDSRKTYTNISPFDITIIEMKESDGIDFDFFLEIDNENEIYENKKEFYKNKPVYILHYPNGENIHFNNGTIKYIEDNNCTFIHLCNTEHGSSGSPIFNSFNHKVVGIHKGSHIKFNYNLGTLIKEPIKEFQEKHFHLEENDKNEITLTYYIDNENINDNNDNYLFEILTEETLSPFKIFGEKFVNNNKNICKIIIEGEENELCSYISPKYYSSKKVEITLKNIFNISNMSYMFCGCQSLISISDNFEMNTNRVTDMSYMFCGCKNLEKLPDMSKWNTSNVENMSSLFCNCRAEIPDISNWNTRKVTNMSYMFSGCTSLPEDISKWDVSNVKDMCSMFRGHLNESSMFDFSIINNNNINNLRDIYLSCYNFPNISKINYQNLIEIGQIFNYNTFPSLPDISKWNTNSLENMSSMFIGCMKLKSLPDISNWDTSNVTNMSGIFCNCESLEILPDISRWNTNKVKNLNLMFYNCKALKALPDISKWNTDNLNCISLIFSGVYLESLPDISKWNTSNVTNMSFMFTESKYFISLPDISEWDTSQVFNMSGMFIGCKSLTSLPDISKWKTSKVTDMSFLFYGCEKLVSLPDISKWNISNVTDMSAMFAECKKLVSLPDISKWDVNDVKDMYAMFCGCKSLKNLPNLSIWNPSNATNMNDMFEGCTSLLSIPNFRRNSFH